MPEAFFFYGTLAAGCDNPAALLVREKMRRIRRAAVRGALYAIEDALGWYPALMPGEGEVWGEVHVPLPAFSGEDLAALDAYEMVGAHDRASGEYRRVAVALADGGAAQAYVYARALPPGARRIGHGDFARWLAVTGLRPFGG